MWRIVVLGLAAAFLASPLTVRALPNTINPSDYQKPKACPNGFDFSDSDAQCVVAKSLQTDKAACTAFKILAYDDTKTACALRPDQKAPAPTCNVLDGYKATLTSGLCLYERATPVSAAGDYIGDCFHILAVPPNVDLVADSRYLVTFQGDKSGESQDRALTLVEAERKFSFAYCKPKVGAKVVEGVKASDLIRTGAYRTGWAYGLLTMPYKYFPGAKSFVSGAPVGPYLGLRFGSVGAGMTVAAALTIGQVNGDTVNITKDAGGIETKTKTGSTQLPAISGAVGVIFDISKAQNTKAFKAGFFIGRDRVNNDPTIDYKYNGRGWLAVQLGYDFTDN